MFTAPENKTEQEFLAASYMMLTSTKHGSAYNIARQLVLALNAELRKQGRDERVIDLYQTAKQAAKPKGQTNLGIIVQD